MHRHAAVAPRLAGFVLLGCGASVAPGPSAPLAQQEPGAAPGAPNTVPAATANPAPAARGLAGDRAHALVIAAAGCWMGGSWGDALGEHAEIKHAGTEARCHDVERRVWSAEDRVHYEQLRALEMNAVADVVAKVDEIAKADGIDAARRDALVRLTSALADEQRELLLARRAADRVKRDLDREPEKLSGDEVDAVSQLRAHAKLDALLHFDSTDLLHEARVLALLGALDHVELARGLPKHLRLYAVADEFQLLFGVSIPDVPHDATKKLVPGTWLTFLSETAKAAGHPVSADAKTPRERDALAWAGMLEGMHDKLKPEADAVSPETELSQVATVALHRLEAEYRAQVSAEATVRPSL